jgi:hydrogenase maturation factor
MSGLLSPELSENIIGIANVKEVFKSQKLGDIGKLAVTGTVNDLAMSGAKPLYLTCGLILEEGLPIATLTFRHFKSCLIFHGCQIIIIKSINKDIFN